MRYPPSRIILDMHAYVTTGIMQYFILIARDLYGTETSSIEERSDITVKQNILSSIRRFLDSLWILLQG